MNKEQKAVVLDYVTEWQGNDESWLQFQWLLDTGEWENCTEGVNPLAIPHLTCRRKPKTITVTMPVPCKADAYVHSATGLLLWFDNHADRDLALAAIREAIGCSD